MEKNGPLKTLSTSKRVNGYIFENDAKTILKEETQTSQKRFTNVSVFFYLFYVPLSIYLDMYNKLITYILALFFSQNNVFLSLYSFIKADKFIRRYTYCRLTDTLELLTA